MRQQFDKLSEREKSLLEEATFECYTYEISKKYLFDMGPLASSELPRVYQTEKTYKTIGSMFEVSDQLVVVEEALKDLIEELEPSAHQFWDLSLTRPNKEPYERRYCGMRINRFIAAIDVDSSGDDVLIKYEDSYTLKNISRSQAKNLFVSARDISSYCIWRDEYNPNRIFFSKQFFELAKKKGFDLPRSAELKEI